MPQVVVRSYCRQFAAAVRREMATRLQHAGLEIADTIIVSISFQGSYSPPVHSRPGDPPYRQSGDLIRSFVAQTDAAALVMRLSSDSPYVLDLEFGYTVDARPHFRRGFYNALPLVTQILCAPM